MYRLVVYETLINVNGGTLYFIGLLAGKTKKLLNMQLRTAFIIFTEKLKKRQEVRRKTRSPTRYEFLSGYTEPLLILLKL